MQRKSTAKIGDVRFLLEHISYKNWCDLARKRGWNGQDGNDGLRDFCEPEDAATHLVFRSKDDAIEAAREIFRKYPDDSAFGSIVIDHQLLEAAHDDSGNLVRGCQPTWETHTTYEIISSGEILEVRP